MKFILKFEQEFDLDDEEELILFQALSEALIKNWYIPKLKKSLHKDTNLEG